MYGSIIAVDDVSSSIAEGEVFGIIGPNGAGTTTTVECISGLRVPDAGSISVYGLSPKTDRDELRKLVGVQLQESSLPPRLKVGEALDSSIQGRFPSPVPLLVMAAYTVFFALHRHPLLQMGITRPPIPKSQPAKTIKPTKLENQNQSKTEPAGKKTARIRQ